MKGNDADLSALLSALSAYTDGISGADPPWVSDLGPTQIKLFKDKSKAKCAQCGRRAGKTHVLSVAIYEKGRNYSGEVIPYIALTSKQARMILWPSFVRLDREYKWGLSLDKHELIVNIPGGASVWLAGADENRKIERIRGGAFPMVCIDEAGSFPTDTMEYLVEDVLEPTLLDYEGELWIASSPNSVCAGYFYDITTGDTPNVAKWPTYHWTVMENPKIPHAKRYLEELRNKKGWTEDHPTYVREWLGQWVRDKRLLVYEFSPKKHVSSEVPKFREPIYSLGVDIGASEKTKSTAFTVCMHSGETDCVWFIESYSLALPGPSGIAGEISNIMHRYDLCNVVADAGALGRGYIDEFVNRFRLPVRNAQKANKGAYMELLSGDFKQNKVMIKVPECQELVNEFSKLKWNEKRDGADDRLAHHVSDSALYAWREARHFDFMEPERQQDPVRAEINRMFDSVRKRISAPRSRYDISKRVGQ